jgi:hypothetical protein
MRDILTHFINTNINTITNDYPWSININRLPEGINLDNGSNYEQNIQLKNELNRLFNEGNLEVKIALIRYYIAVWGGIYRNSAATIQSYATADAQDLIRTMNIKGIASWSKALCVREPDRYAIFDARVSASLNLLQLIHLKQAERVWFPRLSSRNSTVVQINRLIASQNGAQIDKYNAYEHYLSLIHNAASDTNTDIQTVEMILFSSPINLYSEYLRHNS